MLDGLTFDLLSSLQNMRAFAEVDVGWREIVQALMIAPMIVVLDEVGDGALKITGKIVVFEQDSALQREVPSLDLACV